MNHNLFDNIQKNVITTKAHYLSSLSDKKKYVFEVLSSSDKNKVAQAVSQAFEVKVDKVHIINIKGKKKKYRGIRGRTKDRKKAIVTLQSGEGIAVLNQELENS
jgi:large subunit ribosomal protein L23